ncbi:MAG: phytanoyl-CoA dioxygenase family protein [Myxococcales bacterium]|nr:phytanoyl-CoA dioxygenase family protein [Myxococcales bacterium]
MALLPGVLAEDSAALLAARAQAIMAGELAPERWFYQHDSPSGAYEDLAYGDGFIGPSQAYRKVERLERDPLFRAWLEHAALAPLVRALIAGPVALCRAVLWNKAPHGGTELPWHQDGGPFWGLSQQPELQLWTALDDAPREAGCVEAIPGSHRGGLASPEGGTIPRACSDEQAHRARAYPAHRGDVLLLHNLVWHRSGRNTTAAPRRALSVCYMSAATRCTRKRNPRQFTRLFER